MRYNKSQISMEYLIIIGFVVLAILIPAFIILFSSTNKNIGNSVNTQKINDLGKGLTDDAKQMYYLGIYSKKISQYEVPDNVRNIFVLDMTSSGIRYYYLGIYVNSGKNAKVYTFLSDVPLTSDLTSPFVVQDNTLSGLIKECTTVGYTCNFLNFTNSTTKPGMKKFKIETVLSNGVVKSSISPILQ